MIFIQRRFLHKPKQTFFTKLFNKKPKSECHQHIVQIGDPVLRKASIEVVNFDQDIVKDTINTLKVVIDKYDAVGLSAPQIGVNLKIACVQFTAKQLSFWTEKSIKERGMETFDKKILINPKISEIIDKEILSIPEGCCSMLGFSAQVPRYKEINVEYFDENGQKSNWQAKNWTARILQHEIDHLNGRLFTDTMDAKTLEFGYWNFVNRKKGDFKLDFGGMKTLGKFNMMFHRADKS